MAKQILDAYSQCALLRRHPVPTEQMFEPLIRAAAAVCAYFALRQALCAQRVSARCKPAPLPGWIEI